MPVIRNPNYEYDEQEDLRKKIIIEKLDEDIKRRKVREELEEIAKKKGFDLNVELKKEEEEPKRSTWETIVKTISDVVSTPIDTVKAAYYQAMGGLGGAIERGITEISEIDKGIKEAVQEFEKDLPERLRTKTTDKNAIRQWVKNLGVYAAEKANKELENVYKDMPYAKQIVVEGLSSMVQYMPFAFAALFTKAPMVAKAFTLAPLGQISGGWAYKQARDKGFDHDTAQLYAALYEFGEWVGESKAIDIITKPNFGSLFKKYWSFFKADVLGEEFTEIIQAAADKFVLDEKMTWGDFAERLLHTGLVSLVAAGATGSVLLGTEKLLGRGKGKKEEPKEEEAKAPTQEQPIPSQKPLFYGEVKAELTPEEKIVKPEEPTPEAKPTTPFTLIQQTIQEAQKQEAKKEELKIEQKPPEPVIEEVKGEQKKPTLTLGKTERVFTPDNKAIDVVYAVVPANSLIASHDEHGNINPVYPQELQPRQRDKDASRLQIMRIVQELRPELLESSKTVTEGAPIVGDDLIVESGNARTIALQYAYKLGIADNYRNYLLDNAERFGLSPEAINKIENPVLVRIRQTPVDRKQFAYVANTRTTLAMSPAEQAEADAKRLHDNIFALLNIDESGNVLSSSNREFLEAFDKTIPPNELAALKGREGATRQYADRVQAAIFAKAYQNRKLLELQAEALDVDIQNIIKALNQVAKNFAAIKAKYQNDLGVTNSLVDAIDLLRTIKKQGLNFQQWLNQIPMFERPPESTIQIAQYIANNIRSAKALTNFFNQLAQEVNKEAHMLSQPALVEITPRTQEQIMQDALQSLQRQSKVDFQLVLPEDVEKKIKKLAKTYNNRQLEDLLANTDDKLTRNVVNALSSAYDTFMRIARDFKHEAKKYDMFGDITEAIDIVRRADNMGMLVDTFAKNLDMFGKQFSKEALEIAKYLQINKNNSRALRTFFNTLSGNIEKVLQGYSLEEANRISKWEAIRNEIGEDYKQTKIDWQKTIDYQIGDNKGINQILGEYQQTVETETGIRIKLASQSQIDASGIAKMIEIFKNISSPDIEYIVADKIIVDDTVNYEVAKKWELGELSEHIEIAGMHVVKFDGNKWRSFIVVALSNMNAGTLPHEYWHYVEEFSLTEQELARFRKLQPNTEKRCDMFAKHFLRMMKYPNWLNNIFTRIETFFVALNYALRGHGFNYVDVVTFFNKAIRGEYRDRYIPKIEQEKAEFNLDNTLLQIMEAIKQGKQPKPAHEQQARIAWETIQDKIKNTRSELYRDRVPDLQAEVREMREMRARGELDFATAALLQQFESGEIDEQQFAERLLNIENDNLTLLYSQWKDILNSMNFPNAFKVMMFNRILKQVVYREGGVIKVDSLTNTTLQKKPLPPIPTAIRLFYEKILTDKVKGKWTVEYFNVLSDTMEMLFDEYWAKGTPNEIGVKGRWLQFDRESKQPDTESYLNSIAMVQHLSNKATTTAWCIRHSAVTYLRDSDIHMFVDEDGNPRAVVVTMGDNLIREIRGIVGRGQDIEEAMFEPILRYVRDKGFHGGEEYVNNIKMRQELVANRDYINSLPNEERIKVIGNIIEKHGRSFRHIGEASYNPHTKSLYFSNHMVDLDRLLAENDFILEFKTLKVPVKTLFGEVDALETAGIKIEPFKVDISDVEGLYYKNILNELGVLNIISRESVYFPSLKKAHGLDIQSQSSIHLPELSEAVELIINSNYTIDLSNLQKVKNIRINSRLPRYRTNATVNLNKLKDMDRLEYSNGFSLLAENLQSGRAIVLQNISELNLPDLENVGIFSISHINKQYIEFPKLSSVINLNVEYSNFVSLPSLEEVDSGYINRQTLKADSLTKVQSLSVIEGALIAPNLTTVDDMYVSGDCFVYIPKAEIPIRTNASIFEQYSEAIKTGEIPKQFVYIEEYTKQLSEADRIKLKELVNKKLKEFEYYEQAKSFGVEIDVNADNVQFDINRRFLESLNKKEPPIYEKAFDKLGTAISDMVGGVKNWFRVPWWNEVIKPLSKTLYKINSRANVITFEAKEFMRPYLDLKDKTKVDRILLIGDEKQKTFRRYELEALGLTEEEIKAYYGVRKALDYIHKIGIKRFMLDAGWTEQEADAFIDAHYIEGYLPHYRLGRYGVWVGVPDPNTGKKTLYYEAFDTRLEAKKFAEDLMQKGLPKEALQFAQEHNIDPSGYNIFIIDHKRGGTQRMFGEGVNEGHLLGFSAKDPSAVAIIHRYLPLLDAYLKAKGVTNEEIEKFTRIVDKEYLKVLAKGRLARRSGVAGYDIDVEKIVTSYVETTPLALAKKFYYLDVVNEVEKIGKKNGELYRYARDLVDYYYGRKDFESGFNVKFRTFLYLYYLGLKPAFMFVNLSQRFMTTVWYAYYLNGEDGLKAFAKITPLEFRLYGDAIKDFTKGKRFIDTVTNAKYLDPELRDILVRMIKEGDLEAIMHKDIGFKNKALTYLSIFGSLSERSNRLNATLTAFEIGKQKGLSGEALFEFVSDFNFNTQFLYSQANRPMIGRGILAPLFVFKTYMLNYANFLAKIYPNKKAFTSALVFALAMAGLEGLPLLNSLVELLLDIFDSDNPYLRFKVDKAKQEIPTFIRKGMLAQVGLDGSITFGAPELFDVAMLPVITEWIRASSLLLRDDVSFEEKIKRISPTMVKRVINSFTLSEYDLPMDIYGKPHLTLLDIKRMPTPLKEQVIKKYFEMPKEIPEHEKWLYALGFTTPTLNKYYEDITVIKKSVDNYKQETAEYSKVVAKYLAEGKYDEARRQLREAYDKGYYITGKSISYHLGEYYMRGVKIGGTNEEEE